MFLYLVVFFKFLLSSSFFSFSPSSSSISIKHSGMNWSVSCFNSMFRSFTELISCFNQTWNLKFGIYLMFQVPGLVPITDWFIRHVCRIEICIEDVRRNVTKRNGFSIEMGYWKELNFYMFYSIDLFYFSYKLNNLLVLVLTLVLAFLLWCYTYVVVHFVDHDTIIVDWFVWFS